MTFPAIKSNRKPYCKQRKKKHQNKTALLSYPHCTSKRIYYYVFLQAIFGIVTLARFIKGEGPRRACMNTKGKNFFSSKTKTCHDYVYCNLLPISTFFFSSIPSTAPFYRILIHARIVQRFVLNSFISQPFPKIKTMQVLGI